MVRIRHYKRHGESTGEFLIDIRVKLPDGGIYRERLKNTAGGKREARSWGENRQGEVLRLWENGTKNPKDILRTLRGHPLVEEKPGKPLVPTLSQFKEKFLGYARTDRQKASTIFAKEHIIDNHLVPLLGGKRLDEISKADVQSLKERLVSKSPKTTNNVLAVLSKLLRVAKEQEVIDRLPIEKFGLVKISESPLPKFYQFEEYDFLLEAAGKLDPRILAAVLLGGDAGLRAGEVVGLEWPDVSRARGRIVVERQVWRGVVGTPKSGKGRDIPLTDRLTKALAGIRHLQGDRVFPGLTAKLLRGWVKQAQRRAGLAPTGNFHTLRHTFCSHLAMRGVPAVTIKELAGHKHLSTTMRYMHLTEGQKDEAIRLLESPRSIRGGPVAADSEQ